mmetsp:Transcript_53859/g.123955  ORF Transcript_53859/g.123955 Transcript_53859/m.123955 type:complete len:339 (+) Transcript_53859:307-1323(+)
MLVDCRPRLRHDSILGGNASLDPVHFLLSSHVPSMAGSDAAEGFSCLCELVGDVCACAVKTPLTLDESDTDLHEHRFDRERGRPARVGEQLHTDRAANRHMARVEGEARRHDTYKRWRHRESLGEDDLERHRRGLGVGTGRLGVGTELFRERRVSRRRQQRPPAVHIGVVRDVDADAVGLAARLQRSEPLVLAQDQPGRVGVAVAVGKQAHRTDRARRCGGGRGAATRAAGHERVIEVLVVAVVAAEVDGREDRQHVGEEGHKLVPARSLALRPHLVEVALVARGHLVRRLRGALRAREDVPDDHVGLDGHDVHISSRAYVALESVSLLVLRQIDHLA